MTLMMALCQRRVAPQLPRAVETGNALVEEHPSEDDNKDLYHKHLCLWCFYD